MKQVSKSAKEYLTKPKNGVFNRGMTSRLFSKIQSMITLFVLSITFFGFSLPVDAATYGAPETVPGIDQPSAPAYLQVSEHRPDSMELCWNSSSCGVFSILTQSQSGEGSSSYRVQVMEKKTGNVVYAAVTNNNYLTVQGLTSNKAYAVDVHEIEDGIISNASSIVARTAPTAPFGMQAQTETREDLTDAINNKPVNRNSSGSGKYVKVLRWEKPTGKVRYYTVRVYSEDGAMVLQEERVKKPRAIIGSLQPGAYYQYTVAAHFNHEYASPESALQSFRFGKEKR